MDKGRKEEQQAPTRSVALMPFRTEDCLSMVGSVVPLYCITIVGSCQRLQELRKHFLAAAVRLEHNHATTEPRPVRSLPFYR